MGPLPVVSRIGRECQGGHQEHENRDRSAAPGRFAGRLAVRLTMPDRGTDLETTLLTVPRRTSLLAGYTSATVTVGLFALAAVTLLVPLRGPISIAGLDPAVAGVAGVLAWTVFGLLGGTRVLRDPGGHVVMTFHLPFIAAAMLLGGPVAGGWVAMLATFDARELREAPWYGVLANHCGLALAAIAGGFVAAVVTGIGTAIGLPDGLVLTLVAAIAGTLSLTVIAGLLATGVVVLRDGLTPRETMVILDRSFRATAVAETLLGWLFVVVWVAVGWWAPALCTAIVLSLWRASAAVDQLDRDELTGVLSRQAFALRTAEAADRARRGIEGSAYLFLDLDGFKALNDGPRNHQIGDQVLVELGRRLRRGTRVTDAVGRRGGDEFAVLFTGVRDEATAMTLATRIHELVTAPYQTDDGERQVGLSIGVALLTPGRRDFEPDVRQHADAAMYDAKQEGGGVRAWHGIAED